MSSESQGGQNESQDHHDGLRDHEQVPPGDPVGHHPAVEGQEPGRRAGGETDQAKVELGMGQIVDQMPWAADCIQVPTSEANWP